MGVLPLSKLPRNFDAVPIAPKPKPINWLRYGAAATLVASGALLLTGSRRAALVAAATGTTLAMIDQQDTLKKWWSVLPTYIGDVQRLLETVEGTVDEFAAQRQKIGEVIRH